MAEDTRKNILEVDTVQSIDKADTVLVNDNNSLKQVSVETLVSSGIPDQYVTESELTGKGYATTSDLPTKISDLSNDSGFITNDDIPQKLPNPQKIIFTGAVSVEYDGTTQQTVNIPNSGGSGGSYTLPIMSSSQLGGGKAVEKTTEDVPVAVDSETGQLFVPTYPESASSDIPRQEMQNTDTTVTLEPNKLYVFPEMASLTVTLGTPSNTDIVNEWHWFFDSGETACVFSLQNQDGSQVYTDAYSIDANMRYEVSVLHGVAYIKGVSTSAET